jgi:UDP-glucose 4-epimerase
MAEPGVFATLTRTMRPDAIIHLAALVSVPESFRQPMENHLLNVLVPQLVAAAAREYGVKRIVFASSAAVYGASDSLPLTENAQCAPQSPYGEAKLVAETMFLQLAAETEINVRCLRYFNVFGSRQDPLSPYSGVISILEKCLREDCSPTIFGDGEQTRDFISVFDVARANSIVATAVGVKSGVANICTGRAVSLNELYSTMKRVFKKNLVAVYGPAREGDIRHSCGSPEKARLELDFAPLTSLEVGLHEMAHANT